MSEQDDQPTAGEPPERQRSVSNPFAERTAGDTDERPQFDLSKKRAAVMGTAFGLTMALLAFVCVAVSFALSTCTV